MIVQTWQRFPLWDAWTMTTRFLNIACIAFDAEHSRWGSAYIIKDPSKVILERSQNNKKFKVDLPIYLDVLQDQHLLSAIVLQYSYGLIEQHANDVLTELYTRGKLFPQTLDPSGKILDMQELIEKFIAIQKGVENWGTKVLQFSNRKWSDVKDGLKGMVEVSIIRNAIAHGTPTITSRMINRANSHNIQLPWSLGSEVKLTFPILEEYRSRLRSFARVIASGAVT